MLTAGELLRKRPVVAMTYREKPWIEWLNDHRLSRADGLWLADATDLFPPDVATRLVSAGAEDVPANAWELGWIAGLTDGRRMSDELTIDGWWKSKDRLDVSVDSVLVLPELAPSVAFTLLTVEPFDRWFPRDEDLARRYHRRLPLRRLIP